MALKKKLKVKRFRWKEMGCKWIDGKERDHIINKMKN